VTGASPMAPSVAETATLLEAARSIGGPQCATLELVILTLALPFEIVQLDIDDIDWRNGLALVATRRGRRLDDPVRRVLALPPMALDAVRRIAGSAKGSGQVVTGGRGDRLAAKYVRLDRLCDLLAEKAPDTIPIRWNVHGVRYGALNVIAERCDARTIDAVLGRQSRTDGWLTPPSRTAATASAALEIWHQALREAAMIAHG
jgi:integrase